MKFLVKDDTAENQYLFADCCDKVLIANTLADVLPVLAEVESLQAAGYWLAGWISYEASPAFEPRHVVKRSDDNFPLVYFMAVKDVKRISLEELTQLDDSPLMTGMVPKVNEDDYHDACSAVLDYIKEGDIYQANYSFRCTFPLKTDALSLFITLEHQHPVPYSFYMDTGDWQIVSQSPELFLSKNGRQLLSKPMKGTIKRGPDFIQDEELRLELTRDEKSRAENVMIVDLMRNDMSRVCEFKSVQVPELFCSTRYASLHQLTSSVIGEVPKETSAIDILKATFPAGSITGAPKIRAMEVIDELEKDGRGLYTGSAGVFKPGGDFLLNVCIRTIVVSSQKATLGIGSGLVADSAQRLEWEECLLKSSFINFRHKHREVFETMLWQQGSIYLLSEHLQRLENSCEYFSCSFPREEILQKLESEEQSFQEGAYRVRLSVSINQEVSVESQAIINKGWGNSGLSIVLSEDLVNSQDPYLFHKTDNRQLYNESYKKACAEGFHEVIFLNENGYLCEGAISNIFVKKKNRWYTPSLGCGLLPGTWRQAMIQELSAIESHLNLDDLEAAEQILIGNSVRLSGDVKKLTILAGRHRDDHQGIHLESK
jgi:para-aminobenzoate synthetase / 4-amino-4-deoxychorismate lyase